MSLSKKIAAMAVPVVGIALLLAVPASAQAPAPTQPAAEKASSPPTHKWKKRHHSKKHMHGPRKDVSPASPGANIKPQ
jgi:hypothetical protein